MNKNEEIKRAIEILRKYFSEIEEKECFEIFRVMMNEESVDSVFKRWQKNAGLDKKSER